jgi:hypothetical protein
MISSPALIRKFTIDLLKSSHVSEVLAQTFRGGIQPMVELGGKFIIRLKDRILHHVDNKLQIRIKDHLASRHQLKHQVRLERRCKNGKRVPMDPRFDNCKVTLSSSRRNLATTKKIPV